MTKSTIFRLQVVCHGITLCRQRAANPNSHRSAENSPNPKSLASILRDLSLSEEWTYSLQFLFLLPSFRISGGIASFPLLGLREIFRRSAISPFRISVFFFCRSVIPHSTVPSFLLFCPHVKQNSVAGVSISSCLCVFKECWDQDGLPQTNNFHFHLEKKPFKEKHFWCVLLARGKHNFTKWLQECKYVIRHQNHMMTNCH